MTLEELRRVDDVFITPKIAAQLLRCDPHLLRVQARENPEALGFPVTLVGNRTKIPRLAFIRYLEGASA